MSPQRSLHYPNLLGFGCVKISESSPIHSYTEPFKNTLIKHFRKYSNRTVISTVQLMEVWIINGWIIEGPLYYDKSSTQIMVSHNIFTVRYLQSTCILQRYITGTYGTCLSDQVCRKEYVTQQKISARGWSSDQVSFQWSESYYWPESSLYKLPIRISYTWRIIKIY